MKEFTRRDGRKTEGYRQSLRAKNHVFQDQVNNRTEKYTGDAIVTLAVFFLCMGAFLTLLQSAFYATDRDFSYYQMSGVIWSLLRTISILVIVLIPYLVAYEQWAFYATIILQTVGSILILLGANGGFLISVFQWVLVCVMLVPVFLLFAKQREFRYRIHYRFSFGSVLGAVVFLLLQWSNVAYSLHTIFVQMGETVSVGKCYLRAVSLLLPNGQYVTSSGMAAVPMIEGYFCRFQGAFLSITILLTILLTIYAWLVCKPGESGFLETIGYLVTLVWKQLLHGNHRLEEEIQAEGAVSEEPVFALEMEEVAADRQKLDNILEFLDVEAACESDTEVEIEETDTSERDEEVEETEEIGEIEQEEAEEKADTSERNEEVEETEEIEQEEAEEEADTSEQDEEIEETEEIGEIEQEEAEEEADTSEQDEEIEETEEIGEIEEEEAEEEEDTSERDEEEVEETEEIGEIEEKEVAEEEDTSERDEEVEETGETEEEEVAEETDTSERDEEVEETGETEEEEAEEKADTSERNEGIEETGETEEEEAEEEEDTSERDEEVEETGETEEEEAAEEAGISERDERIEETEEIEQEEAEGTQPEEEAVDIEGIEEEDTCEPEEAQKIPVIPREISACVADFGLNFASYMALDSGGKIFTGEYVEGYIPYRIIGKEAIISGGPICRMEDMAALLREYEGLCYEKKISMTFVNVSKEQAESMESLGFSLVHCGAEPRFTLKHYKLKNPAAVRNQREKIRERYGVSIAEYRYYEKRDFDLEMKMLELNDDWLDSRNGENFTIYKRRQRDAFLPQTMDFAHGDGRRYYYALDKNGEMAGFIVFCPVTSQNGYSCEAGRKRPGMVKNLMELIMHEAFAALKAEGANWASMGLMPDCTDQTELNTRQIRWQNFIYRYYESIYGCKDYKEAVPKYKPTSWEDMYIVTREYQTMKSERI